MKLVHWLKLKKEAALQIKLFNEIRMAALVPESNTPKGESSTTVCGSASIKPECRLILFSLYFFILYENPSISFLRN